MRWRVWATFACLPVETPGLLEADFLRPIFLGVKYRVDTLEEEGTWRVRLFDGKHAHFSVRVTAEMFQEDETPVEPAATNAFERTDPAVRQQEDIVPGLKVSGAYACNAAALSALAARWRAVDRRLVALLAWSSYLVGMELPGESALFFKLVLRLAGTAPYPARMRYHATVSAVKSQIGQVKTDVSLLIGDSTVAFQKPARPLFRR